MHPSASRNLRAAVYMNNAGCGMVSHGAFDDAHKCFSDAVFVIRQGVCQVINGSEAPVSVAFASLDLKQRIQQSAQLTASPHVWRTVSIASSFSPPQLDDFAMLEVDEILLQSTHRLQCPIRIEGELLFQDFDEALADQAAAIMLYNLGNSCFSLSRFQQDGSQDLRL